MLRLFLFEAKEAHLRHKFYTIALSNRIRGGMDERQYLDGFRAALVHNKIRMALRNLGASAQGSFKPHVFNQAANQIRLRGCGKRFRTKASPKAA